MKLALVVLALATGLATAADAQLNGRIAIFSDAALTDSSLVDTFPPRIADVYIAHVNHSGVTGSRFKVVADPGFAGIWSSEASPFAEVIGTSASGIEIYYASCIAVDVVVLSVTYLLPGTSSACSRLRVVPYPGDEPYIVCNGCDFVDLPCSGGGTLHVNCTVPVESTTWGRVKALYR